MSSLFALLKQAFLCWKKDRASSLAAALAYHAIFSLAPLLIVILAIVGFVYQQPSLQDQVVMNLQELMGRDTAEFVKQLLDQSKISSQSRGAFWLGTLLTLVGSIGVFKQLQESVRIIWGTAPLTGSWKNVIWRHVWLFLLVVFTGVLLILSLMVSAVLSSERLMFLSFLPASTLLISVFHQLTSLAIVALLFAVLFRYLPGTSLAWRNVLFAAGFTSLLFAVGKYALGFYLGRGTVGLAYGAAGSLVALLVWIFYATQIFLYGVEMVKVSCQSRGSSSVPASLRADKDKEKKQVGKGAFFVLFVGIFLKIRDHIRRTK